MTGDRTRDFGFVVLMSVVGLASGVLTAALSDGHFSYGLGVPFGAIMAFSLAITGIVPGLWRAAFLFALIACTFVVSVMSAAEAELGIRKLLMIVRETDYPSSFFVGGMVGGFIVMVGVLFLAEPKRRFVALLRKALPWALFAGTLAPIAWTLGPSLGVWVWSGLHAVGLTTPTNTLQNVLYGETGYGAPNRLFALFVLWQTGMAFALGITLRGNRAISSSEELKLA